MSPTIFPSASGPHLTSPSGVKREQAAATADMMAPDDLFEVLSLGSDEPRLLPRRILAEIVEPRMHELFLMVRQEILKSGYFNSLPAGIVLSGGGSQLLGSAALCQEVTGMPTRIGSPRDVGGISGDLRSPVYATAIGLVQYGALPSPPEPSAPRKYASRQIPPLLFPHHVPRHRWVNGKG